MGCLDFVRFRLRSRAPTCRRSLARSGPSQARFRKFYQAIHALRTQLDPRLSSEGMRQGHLDQFPTITASTVAPVRRCLDAGLAPLQTKGTLRDPPPDLKRASVMGERAVLRGIGGELVERQRQGLGMPLGKGYRRAFDPDSIAVKLKAMGADLHLHQLVQPQPCLVLAGNQPLDAGQSLNAAVELHAESFKGFTTLNRAP